MFQVYERTIGIATLVALSSKKLRSQSTDSVSLLTSRYYTAGLINTKYHHSCEGINHKVNLLNV